MLNGHWPHGKYSQCPWFCLVGAFSIIVQLRWLIVCSTAWYTAWCSLLLDCVWCPGVLEYSGDSEFLFYTILWCYKLPLVWWRQRQQHCLHYYPYSSLKRGHGLRLGLTKIKIPQASRHRNISNKRINILCLLNFSSHMLNIYSFINVPRIDCR